MDTQTMDGSKAQKQAPQRDERKTETGKRTSAELAEVWGECKAAYSVVPKRPAATCNLTVQSSLRRADVEKALTEDEATARKWSSMVRARVYSLVGDGKAGAVDAGCYASQLDAYKGVSLRIGGRLYDGVALASALRNERADILGGKASAE